MADVSPGGIPSLAPRADFPILAREINGKPLIYLDSAASAQKPRQVLDAMDTFARTCYSNTHRGAYTLSEEATAPMSARASRSPGSSTPTVRVR